MNYGDPACNLDKDKLHALIPQDASSDPLTGININELSNRIEQSIELLPDACRKIFILSRSEELSHKDIALQLGISEYTVKVQIYRALVKLHVLLREFLPN